MKKGQNKREKYRQKALAQINYQNLSHLQLFSNLGAQSEIESEDIQYLTQFDEMKNQKPNQQGTGRITLTKTRQTIGVINLSLNKSIRINKVKLWVNSYLGIKVKILHLNLALFFQDNKFYIYDQNNELDYELKSDKNDIIDVFSLFDVLVNFIPKDICSLVVIIDQDIFDPCQPKQNIVGRACGDRICVVQYSDDKEEFYGTIIHELLHTFGFNHCYLWDCIMNENISGIMQLCIHDLEKLQLVKQFNILQRYQKIQKISKELGLGKECIWLTKMINAIQHPRIEI